MAAATGWLALLALNALGETVIGLRQSRPGSVDTHLVRILVRILGITAVLYMGIYVADSFGIPAAPLIASLGVGGLAIALAVRPTLENIVGGFILFADKPVRVGDFCRYGESIGTVEEIGLRSTRIRSLERTLVTVPNADFAQMSLENFAARDLRLLRTRLQLRYETTPEQMRYVLARLRELLVAHPRVTPDPARVRLVDFGAFSKDVEIFAYLRCRDEDSFLAIQEDILLRIEDIIQEAGTGFAFPSQTAYIARDTGLDAQRTAVAEAAVQAWRDEGQLPFPNAAAEERARLADSLDYPPRGSAGHQPRADQADLLSAAPPCQEEAARAAVSRS